MGASDDAAAVRECQHRRAHLFAAGFYLLTTPRRAPPSPAVIIVVQPRSKVWRAAMGESIRGHLPTFRTDFARSEAAHWPVLSSSADLPARVVFQLTPGDRFGAQHRAGVPFRTLLRSVHRRRETAQELFHAEGVPPARLCGSHELANTGGPLSC